MLIRIQDLRLRRLEFKQEFPPGSIDFGAEVRQQGPLVAEGRADLVEEHRGGKLGTIIDIRLVGSLAAAVELACARCLEPVERKIRREYDLIFRPRGVDRRPDKDEVGISGGEAEIGYYDAAGLLLEDVLREQVLLAVPMREICREECRGLCPQCGRNLNQETCECAASADPRWSALKEWKQ